MFPWYLFKKIRDTKGTFHAKMGSIKDRNGMDLAEAEDIKKRWQEYTEELYKKDLHGLDNHDDVITNLEPDILESEVKWALEKYDHGIWSHHFMANRGGNNGNSDSLFSWVPKSLEMVTAVMKLKDAYCLEEKL